jgi:hypothetical protein
LSDDKEDPNEIRARKALLRLAKPGRDEVSEVNDADVDALAGPSSSCLARA